MPDEATPTFYKIDSTRITVREYCFGTPWILIPLLLPIALLLKLLRIRLPGSTDDPSVDAIWPFQVTEADLPEEVRAKFQPIMQELSANGFVDPVFHDIRDVANSTRIYWATCRHQSGQAIARIHYRVWTGTTPTKTYLFPIFLSPFVDGAYLVSSAGKPDMLPPPSCQTHHKKGATATQLWAMHQQLLAKESLRKAVRPVKTTDEMRWMIEEHHGVVRDFHLQRGVFVAPTEADRQRMAAVRENISSLPPEAAEHAEVLAEIDRLERKQTSWVTGIAVLVISMAVFAGAGSKAWSWEFALFLVSILLFHELGHYVTMRIFKYRNLRMFFIPLFGAAVTGQHYNVPGWKKAIVSLAGPLPGIAVGTVLGVIGLILHNALLVKAALLTLILNGFNLLPVLPLDGGWVMHAVLFSRHYLLDTGFRALAGLTLLGSSLLIDDKLLRYLGIFMLVSVHAGYRVARVADTVKKQGLPPVSPDSQHIPPATAVAIIGELKKSFKRGLTSKTAAQFTLNVFERLNARPPSWLASVAILGVHLGSGICALVFAALFVVGEHGDLSDFVKAAVTMPVHKYECGTIETWRGVESTHDRSVAQNTIVATFASAGDAENTFAQFTNRLPPRASASVIGQSLLVALPADDDAARNE